jgi:hypothetical protein
MLVVVKVSAGTVMVIMKESELVPQVASVTVTSIGYVPAVVGVPVMVLPEATRPGGVPDMDQTAPEQTVPLQLAEKLVL